MKTPVVLIVSTGVKDIKVVCRDKIKGAVVLRTPDTKGHYPLRQLHERWLSGDILYHIVSSEAEIREQAGLNEDAELDLSPDDHGFIRLGEPGRAEFDDRKYEAITNNNNEYLLFPAKLHTVVAGLRENHAIIAALILYTDRKYHPEFQDEYNREPVASGKLIAEWLGREGNVNPIEGADFENHDYCHLNYLKDEVAMEGDLVVLQKRFSPYGQPMALSAITEIEKAVAAMAKRHEKCLAVISHTGGPGDVKAPLVSAVRLHFGGNMIEIHDNKYTPFNPEYLSLADYRIPARNLAMDIRHQTALRLWEGDFAGAWAVASYIEKNDPSLRHDAWVQQVREAANFMQGWREHDKEIIDPFVCVPKGLRNLVLLAWRVEAALQHDQGEPLLTDALRQLMTFREKMLEYMLLTVMSRTEEESVFKVDLDTWKIDTFEKDRIKGNTFINKQNTMSYRLKKRGGRLNTFNLHKINEHFKDVYGDTTEHKIFERFSKVVTQKQIPADGGWSLRKYRNELTHGVLDANVLKAIKDYGEQEDLWAIRRNHQDEEELGQCFLNRDMVSKLFESLGYRDCTEAYRQFVQGLIRAVKSPGKCIG